MAISYYECIRNACRNVKSWRTSDNHIPDRYEGVEYDASKLVIPVIGDTIDIPFFGIDDYLLVLENNLLDTTPKYNTVYYPLASTKPYAYRGPAIKDTYKSAAPAIKAWFTTAKTKEGIIPIKIGTTQYYGGSGIILNKNKELLLLMTITLQKTIEDNKVKYTIIKPNVYIDTRVYTEEGTIHKHIKQKLLPEVFNLKFMQFVETTLRNNIIAGTSKIRMDFKVIIDDLSYWITRPSIPNVTDTSEAINKWLADTLVVPEIDPIVRLR